MVTRHHEIDFAGGAMVFPGGKTDPGDRALMASGLCEGVSGLEEDDAIARVTALREGFEESGFLLARDRYGQALGADALAALAPQRAAVANGSLALETLLRSLGLRLACDALTPFAHWLGPRVAPRRFDTRFYLAVAPPDQSGSHDGSESVDSRWISPREALGAADRGEATLVFPTRRNLERLAQFATIDAVCAAVAGRPVPCVEPFVADIDGQRCLCIRDDAGYPVTSEPLATALPRTR